MRKKPTESARGRRKRTPSPSPDPGALHSHLLMTYRGDFLYEDGRHTATRARAVLTYVIYAATALLGSAWILVNADPGEFLLLGIVPLAASAVMALGLATISHFNTRGRIDRIRALVRWTRRVGVAFLYALHLGVAVLAMASTAAALYSASLDNRYDTRALQATAFLLAYMATFLSLMAASGTRLPVFSVITGRSHRGFYGFAAITRVLVILAIFVALAELTLPQRSAWLTAAMTLLLTSIGWELSKWANPDNSVRAVAEAAAVVQAASSQPVGELVASLAQLEITCLHRAVGKGSVVEAEVGIVVRACLERLDPHERRTYPPGTTMQEINNDLSQLNETDMRDQIAEFAVLLRQSLVLHKPMFSGNVWSAE